MNGWEREVAPILIAPPVESDVEELDKNINKELVEWLHELELKRNMKERAKRLAKY